MTSSRRSWKTMTRRIFKQFNWRFLLVRILVNGLALDLTALLVPRIYFVDKSIWNWLLMSVMLGVLNALIKPILQYLTLRFIFATFGLVVVLVNAMLLWLLSLLFPDRFAVDNLLWALVGGLVLGLVSSFLESLLGLTMPVVPDEPPELRQYLERQARQTNWLVADGKARQTPAQGQTKGDAAARPLAPPPVAVEPEAASPELQEAPLPSETEPASPSQETPSPPAAEPAPQVERKEARS
ncbi:MAG TPA: hypothetical protein ENJ31_13255 [Anaerolineae bacterium]|nr:hypothetical protein [Anaerolineae bacterium]